MVELGWINFVKNLQVRSSVRVEWRQSTPVATNSLIALLKVEQGKLSFRNNGEWKTFHNKTYRKEKKMMIIPMTMRLTERKLGQYAKYVGKFQTWRPKRRWWQQNTTKSWFIQLVVVSVQQGGYIKRNSTKNLERELLLIPHRISICIFEFEIFWFRIPGFVPMFAL